MDMFLFVVVYDGFMMFVIIIGNYWQCLISKLKVSSLKMYFNFQQLIGKINMW